MSERAKAALDRHTARTEPPDGWESGAGSASRPVSDGGHYDHWYYRRLPGSNQHVERYLECHIYAEASRHVFELTERREDDTSSWEVDRIGGDRVRIPLGNRDDYVTHARAEIEIHEKAYRAMDAEVGND